MSRPNYNTSAWLSRVILLLLIAGLTVLTLETGPSILQPSLNRFLRSLGVPYEGLLWAEHNIDYFTHSFGSFVIVLLLHFSNLPRFRTAQHKFLLYGMMVLTLMLVAEIMQWLIGRGFSFKDIMMGGIGIACAVLVLKAFSETSEINASN